MSKPHIEKTVAGHRRHEESAPDVGGESVTDSDGDTHRLTDELGSGGQGAVYATDNEELAVKLISPSADRDAIRERFRQIRRLPVNDLPISRPFAVLEPPHAGYVMSWLSDMEPIGNLSDMPGGENGLEWYTATGGLRRRLRLLGRLARIFATLHGRGLVFADPSPNNVFVSASADHEEVWLIDPDNLQFESNISDVIFTPFYGAPELVREESGNNALTDVFGFAVIAFEMLALAHPLIGDDVDANPELEEAAMRGELPWVEHPERDENRASFGLSGELVLSERLRNLAHRTFGPGLNDPLERPGAATWSRALQEAADMTLECKECGWTYYVGEVQCPRCDTPKPAYVLLQFARWVPEGNGLDENVVVPSDSRQHAVVAEGGALKLEKRHTLQSHEPLELSLGDDALELSATGPRDCSFVIASRTWDREKDVSPSGVHIPLARDKTAKWSLHFGSRDEPHRVVRFRRMGGG